MQIQSAKVIRILLKASVILLALKVVLVTLITYRDYMPPKFDSDFLAGRQSYFWEGYHWAFYPHIVAGPVTLLLGLVLLSESIRRRWPRWHRWLGRTQVGLVLLVVVPSGFVMGFRAAFGPIAAVGLIGLALATAVTVTMGWRTAIQRRFDVHRKWMLRCYTLLFSAVVIRLLGGIGEVAGVQADWYYIQATWTSWIIPLIGVELLLRRRHRIGVR
ncbi:MAG: DUF2306 domain-containing protein [Planctomycetaceae bacterium]